MYIEKVLLKNFRNYKNCEINLSKKLNVFKGNNAQGKTNFLESIYIASISRSPKSSKEKDIIMWGQDTAKIEVEVKKNIIAKK